MRRAGTLGRRSPYAGDGGELVAEITTDHWPHRGARVRHRRWVRAASDDRARHRRRPRSRTGDSRRRRCGGAAVDRFRCSWPAGGDLPHLAALSLGRAGAATAGLPLLRRPTGSPASSGSGTSMRSPCPTCRMAPFPRSSASSLFPSPQAVPGDHPLHVRDRRQRHALTRGDRDRLRCPVGRRLGAGQRPASPHANVAPRYGRSHHLRHGPRVPVQPRQRATRGRVRGFARRRARRPAPRAADVLPHGERRWTLPHHGAGDRQVLGSGGQRRPADELHAVLRDPGGGRGLPARADSRRHSAPDDGTHHVLRVGGCPDLARRDDRNGPPHRGARPGNVPTFASGRRTRLDPGWALPGRGVLPGRRRLRRHGLRARRNRRGAGALRQRADDLGLPVCDGEGVRPPLGHHRGGLAPAGLSFTPRPAGPR